MGKEKPFLSIIIPSYNQGEYIERTILSVLNQSSPCKYELIVIDGGSTDNTLQILEKYSNKFSYWVSEKDSGQSEAINKGFSLACGEYVTWLNSDDVLFKSALNVFEKTVAKNKEIKLFFGNTAWISSSDEIIQLRKGPQYNSCFAKKGFYHAYGPSAFIHRDLLDKYGLLREDFHYMMDTELWSRYMSKNVKYHRISTYIWGLRLHEKAKMSGHNFENSEFSQLDHPSFKRKKVERVIINELYPATRYIKLNYFLYNMYKLLSLNFLHSLLQSIRLRKKHWNSISN